jgi:hypothetical protein
MSRVPQQKIIGFGQYKQIIAGAVFHLNIPQQQLKFQTRAPRCACRDARTIAESQ